MKLYQAYTYKKQVEEIKSLRKELKKCELKQDKLLASIERIWRILNMYKSEEFPTLAYKSMYDTTKAALRLNKKVKS